MDGYSFKEKNHPEYKINKISLDLKILLICKLSNPFSNNNFLLLTMDLDTDVIDVLVHI